MKVVAIPKRKYENMDIVSHQEIDKRGWKKDPGPILPFGLLDDLLAGSSETDGKRFYSVSVSRLFVRSGPGIDHEPVGPPEKLVFGTRVELLEFDGSWFLVEPNETLTHRGQVHSRYLERIWE